MTIAELNAAKMAAKAERYPSFPLAYLKPAKSSQSDTNSLTKAIVDYVCLSGGFAYRVNTMGVYREGERFTDVMGNVKRAEGKWTKSGSTKGVADILACHRGRSFAIEVKFGKDTQSDGQRNFQRNFEAVGGVYIIAKTFDAFVLEFRKFL